MPPIVAQAPKAISVFALVLIISNRFSSSGLVIEPSIMAMSYSLALLAHCLAPFDHVNRVNEVEHFLFEIDDLQAGILRSRRSRKSLLLVCPYYIASGAILQVGITEYRPVHTGVIVVNLAVSALADAAFHFSFEVQKYIFMGHSASSSRASSTNLYITGGPQMKISAD